MKVKRVTKVVRPNDWVPYNPDYFFEDENSSIGIKIKENYFDTGKIISSDVSFTTDGLSVSYELVFASKADMDSFENESFWNCPEREQRKQYQIDNNIISTIEYFDIPD